MSVNDHSTAPREFAAHPPFWGAKYAKMTASAWSTPTGKLKYYALSVVAIFGFGAVLSMVYQACGRSVGREHAEMFDYVFRYGGVILLFGGFGAYYTWSQGRKIVISVTSEGLSVKNRPGELYPFSTATLGTWGITGGMTMGTTLHLHCGSRRFVLGGRDFRVGDGTRLDAPDAGYGLPVDVDAWVSSADFDEILTMAAAQGRLQVRRPSPDDPSRVLLFPNPLLVQRTGSFAFAERQRILQASSQPRLAIDVREDSVRVVDVTNGALVASAPLMNVSAAPVTFEPSVGHWFPTVGQVLSDYTANRMSVMPGIVLSMPGAQPLTLGCRDSSGLVARFSWRGDVGSRNDHAEYVVSSSDWLTLVDRFGLTQWLHGADSARS
jgi:hypothetical protein